MKYICKICGYVYDDDKQSVPFAALPDNWVCPLCGAAKADFEVQAVAPEISMPSTTVVIDDDMQKLTVREFAALCSNLARGCEKQYHQEEAKLFDQLADYFIGIMPVVEDADLAQLAAQLQNNLETDYPMVRATAAEQQDRGALRVCTWGEKVTRILNGLVQRYEKEGEAFLADTEVWVCTVCGFVYVGDVAPELCPVCKVPAWKFEKMEREVQA